MIYLHGIGHFHPENVITNSFLADLDIGCSEEWIVERLGIESRRTVLDLDYIRYTKNRDPRQAIEASAYTHAEIGARAAEMALERAGVSAEDIGLLICGSSAPEHVSPAEAARVAAELGITVPCLDITSACTTFGAQIFMLNGMEQKAAPPYILLVNPESLTQVVDYSDRRSVPIFGDCATAAVVSLSLPSPLWIDKCVLESNPAGWNKVMVPRLEHFIQDGNAVQGFAIRKATEGLRRIQAECSSKGVYSVKFIGHQANLGMLRTVAERCNIPESNHWHNVVEYGNTGCASAPSVLSQNWERLRHGDHVALVLVGSGLTWISMIIEVGDKVEGDNRHDLR